MGAEGNGYKLDRTSVAYLLLLRLLLDATTDNEIGTALPWASGLHAESVLTPWSLRILETDRRVSFSTSVWVIDGVHRLSEDLWLTTHPAHTSCLTNTNEVVVWVADGTNRCVTLATNATHLSTRKFYDRVVSIETDENGTATSRTDDLSATTDREFEVENSVSDGNVLETHAVTCLHLRAISTNDFIANGESFSCKNVSLVSIHVVHEGEAGGAVWIVLESCDATDDAMLLRLLEVDQAE